MATGAVVLAVRLGLRPDLQVIQLLAGPSIVELSKRSPKEVNANDHSSNALAEAAKAFASCRNPPEPIAQKPVSLTIPNAPQFMLKELYRLLETILRLEGLAMTRSDGNLVTIVPVAEALEADPQIVDPNTRALEAGDVVVTRVFEIRYADASAVAKLIEGMKLAVAVSCLEKTQTLMVTCYALRMAQVERWIDLVDRPGRPREFKFRQMTYTLARPMAEKVRVLVEQWRDVQGSASSGGPRSTTVGPGSPPPKGSVEAFNAGSSPSGQGVFLDTDERTNRILMIGYPEQISAVETMIDALDVAQQDLRTLKVRPIKYMDALAAYKKLMEFGVVGASGSAGRLSKVGPAPTPEGKGGTTADDVQVLVLETINALLVNATAEQDARITETLAYIDVKPQDMRTLRSYVLHFVDALEAQTRLQDLGMVGRVGRQMAGAPGSPGGVDPDGLENAPGNEPQVLVLENRNSLLINATESHHSRIQAVLSHLDAEPETQAIPYEIYFLENQAPQHLADVLTKIIRETVTNAEGKVEKVINRTTDQIVIVPDDLTFSLIVYGNKKNQDWISSLVKKLDRRRAQVLIDVTLVEIRKTDEFAYDLNLLGSSPQPVPLASPSGTGPAPVLPQAGFESKGGSLTGFYVDTHLSALLTAMQRKNYGRILAKPKVLVNDNEKGTIKTTETTYVTRKSSIPVTNGTGGQQSTLIETAVDYQGYDAGITLLIVPHIGEGDLLRLEITTNRSDFGTISGDKPPDRTSSDLTTVVTVPDGSTIILGGMIKLNQSRGGKKVPILGDLPIIGLPFRGIGNTDVQSKLYIFVRAQIIRPAQATGPVLEDLQRISDENRRAFERHEAEFQSHKDVPGVEPNQTRPAKILDEQ